MKLVYFAWVREQIGVSEENITLPEEISTVDDLLTWLPLQSTGHATALGDTNRLRIAVNQTYVHGTHAIQNDDEIAIFPPVTGG